MRSARKKRRSTKTTAHEVWKEGAWVVRFGELKRRVGHPGVGNLFTCLGEKLPWDSLSAVSAELKKQGVPRLGVYIAHDSMGCSRYIGRGRIFQRLRSHKRRHTDELCYYSFYVVEDKKHEREIETLLIRAAGFLLVFNPVARRVGVGRGNVRDYEAGTHYFERGTPTRAKVA